MARGTDTLRFVLNNEEVALTSVAPALTLLDFLRLEKRLRGSKEGCAEGDCGACTVLVGRVKRGELTYEAMTACIVLVGMLHGAHVVSVEHLAPPEGPLHPVQQAMVDCHGSQCGFCTPGIVMSLYALWLGRPRPAVEEIETALQGNLCRCTGYAPIVKAGLTMGDYGLPENDRLHRGRAEMTARLEALADRVEIGAGAARLIVPDTVDDLAAAYAAHPQATLVAGATDVGLWVTKFMREIGPVIAIGALDELHHIDEGAEALVLGAAVTYAEAELPLLRRFPELQELWDRIGGTQIRNSGTIGGNIANGSPIGDTPPPFIALGATLTLRHGPARRELPLENFFLAYGKQDRRPGEFVEKLTIPYLPSGENFACYKVSKRLHEDISALCGAFRLRLDAAGKVAAVRIVFGGMAGTPKRAAAVEGALLGLPWTAAAVDDALAALDTDFTPLTDMRASKHYRRLAAGNLLKRFYFETTGAGERLKRAAV